MPEIRETEVEHDGERIYVERIDRSRRGGGGFGWGLLLGVLLIAMAIVGFSYSQGSFQSAGREADQATAQAETQLSQTAENAGDAIESAGDSVEATTDRVAADDTTTPDTVQN